MGSEERHQSEAIGHGFQGRDIAMLVGAAGAPRWGLGQEPVEELVRWPEREQWDRPRVAIDTARLHDAVVGMAPSFDFLPACHRLALHEAQGGVKCLKT
jgi:hypothetical protein